MALTIWRKHIWKSVARMLHKRDGVPIDLAVRAVRANRGWLEECWAGWSAYKLWDKLTDAEADWWGCQRRLLEHGTPLLEGWLGDWPYWRENETPDIPRAMAERYGLEAGAARQWPDRPWELVMRSPAEPRAREG